MSVGLSLPQLNAIACGAINVNAAAGGAAGFNLTGDYMPDLITIACQLRNANVALGGSGAGAGGFDSVGNLMVYITCQAQGMAAATGTGSAMPWEPYNMLQMWQAIDCALGQVITNTGATAKGYFNNSVYSLMQGAICLLGEIASHGFGGGPLPPDNLNASPGINFVQLDWDPPALVDSYNIYRSTVDGGPYSLIGSAGAGFVEYDDNTALPGTTYYYVVTTVLGAQESGYSNQASAAPLSPAQAFVNQLLDFLPDVLLVGDLGTSTTTNGQPVTTWLDQSGNGNDASQTGTARPLLQTNAQNGKTALQFDGTNDVMLGAFVGGGAGYTDIVVYKADVAADNAARVIAVGPVGVDEAGTPLGIVTMRFDGSATHLGAYYASVGQAGFVTTVRNQFHLASLIFASGLGASIAITEDGVTQTPFGSSNALAATAYSLGAGITASTPLRGSIAFRAIWASDKSADMAAILPIIKAYYNTP